jgi:hypothetical protein
MKNLNLLLIKYFFILLCFTGIILQAGVPDKSKITSPEKHFGFKPGTDEMLFDYENLISYLKKLDAASPMLKLVNIGKSSQNREMFIAFISSEENIKNLKKLQEINRQLALEPNLTNAQREGLFNKGKVFFLATLSMHSGEVGPSQSAPLIAYDLITSDDPITIKWLDDVVYMMVPCHNPDGMDMIVNHYNKYKNTKWDGSDLPGVYHEYIGHNINRDFVTLSQDETKSISNIYTEWFPQVMVEKHQMGSRGPRYFVPPNHDPIAQNINETIWNWTWIFGSNMSKDMTKAGQAGVSQQYVFDNYWPGSTETCLWKGVIAMLTEAASTQYGNPIYVEQNELRVSGKGLSEYKKSINMPLPWEGGWWRLGDIINYEISSTKSIIKTASLYRKDILEFRNDLCKKEVDKGQNEPPYYYVLPLKQHDTSELVSLVNLLKEHGVSVYQLKEKYILNNKNYYAGDIVVPVAQPFRAFIKEVLERQKFPVRHYTPDGKIIKPYDITSWSLPLHKGVKSIEIVDARSKEFESLFDEINEDFKLKEDIPNDFWASVFTVNNNESFKVAFHALKLGLKPQRLESEITLNGRTIPKGSFLIYGNSKAKKLDILFSQLTVSPIFIDKKLKIQIEPLKIPRIALVESYFHDMDAGWTRFIFDKYYIPYKIIRPGNFENTNFVQDFDVIVFPDKNKSILMEGKWKSDDDKYFVSDYPPEFTKGIGKEGMIRLMNFIDKNGIIIAWGGSTELFTGVLNIKHSEDDIEEFQLPFQDISKELQKKGLYCPGSFLNVSLVENHPITFGLQKNIGVFSRGKPIFSTSIPSFDMDRRVIGKYPEENILLSGYCENEEKIGNKTNIVWLKKGNSQLVLFGFSPQFRGQTNASFKLLFNSILLPEIE